MRLLHCGIGFTVSLFYGIAVGLNVPIKDIRRLRQDLERRGSLNMRDATAELENVFHQYEKRITCVYDLYLDSFTEHPEDSEPFCSSYLGIQPATATSTFITKTTITSIDTVYQSIQGPTITVGGDTVTLTLTEDIERRAFWRRQASISSPVPVASIASLCSETPGNSSLISSVSHACSCLFLTTATNVVAVTSTTTRVFSAKDFQPTTIPKTVTAETTVTVSRGPRSTSSSRAYSESLTIPIDTKTGGTLTLSGVLSSSGSVISVLSSSSTSGLSFTLATSSISSPGVTFSSESSGTGSSSIRTGFPSLSSSVIIPTGTQSGNPTNSSTISATSETITPIPATPASSLASASNSVSSASFSGNPTIPTGPRDGGPFTSPAISGSGTASYATTLSSLTTTTTTLTGTVSLPPSSDNGTSSAGTSTPSNASSILSSSPSTGLTISLNNSISTSFSANTITSASSSGPSSLTSDIFTGPTSFPSFNVSSRAGAPTSPETATSTSLPSVTPSVSSNISYTPSGITTTLKVTFESSTSTSIESSLLSSNSASSSSWSCAEPSTAVIISTTTESVTIYQTIWG